MHNGEPIPDPLVPYILLVELNHFDRKHSECQLTLSPHPSPFLESTYS
jgi:hypothetical protein